MGVASRLGNCACLAGDHGALALPSAMASIERSSTIASSTLVAFLVLLSACERTAPAQLPAPHTAATVSAETARVLDAVAAVHGEAGPFAVAGYRMGTHALATLGSRRGAHEIVFEHHAPATVGWSCIADGAQAASAASVGHLDLARVDAPESDVRLVARHRDGRTLEYRLHPRLLATLGAITPDNARALGARVAEMRDEDVFVVATP